MRTRSNSSRSRCRAALLSGRRGRRICSRRPIRTGPRGNVPSPSGCGGCSRRGRGCPPRFPCIHRTPGTGASAFFGCRTRAFIVPAPVAILTVRDVSDFPPPVRSERSKRSRDRSIFMKFFYDGFLSCKKVPAGPASFRFHLPMCRRIAMFASHN